MSGVADGLSGEARRVAAELHLATAAVRARHERAVQQRREVVAARWADVVSRADRGPEELQTEIERAHEHLPAPRTVSPGESPATLDAPALTVEAGTDEERSTP
ncbi:hypothetical protein [Kineococcus radiotolerans]|uniref:Uncharacterized protein n=1 Tax=Kineococcus radiotolerans (strain ATCC BAA-149 / DSM 14245 / SRS30216) TaxID=266940 RepID=A6W9F0_KINRD|nr:hypothetical protein [Kineococcus radiotolerans]ABS03439.1 hypothetical protein Krad_1953 [Kineococcus radiotolerans SRS30216 = ATCC BAA-149]